PVLGAGRQPSRLLRGLLRVLACLSGERLRCASPGARYDDRAESRLRVEREGGPGLPGGPRRRAAQPGRRREPRRLPFADTVHTGDCVNNASTGLSESIIALDASCSGVSVDGSCPGLPPVTYPPNPLTPGNPVWGFQAHPNGELQDLDFGSSPNVITDAAGVPVLVGAGSKDGTYYAVTAGRGPGAGQLVWKTTTSVASAAGGFEGSTGFAAGAIFGTTVSGPGFETALDAFTGSLKWDAPDAASSLSPVGIVNGLVFAGENLGAFKARDLDSGLPLFVFDAGGPIATGPVIAAGMVFVGRGVLPGRG